LIAAFPVLTAGFEQPGHGANGALKPAFIEQYRVDLRGRAILKTLLMKARQHGRLPLSESARAECRASLSGHSGKLVGGGHKIEAAAVEVDGVVKFFVLPKPRAVSFTH